VTKSKPAKTATKKGTKGKTAKKGAPTGAFSFRVIKDAIDNVEFQMRALPPSPLLAKERAESLRVLDELRKQVVARCLAAGGTIDDFTHAVR
jgi:hypothetical protein